MFKRKIATAALVALGLFVSLEYKSVAQQEQPMTQPSPGATQPSPNTTQPTPSTTQQNGTKLSTQDRQFMMQAAQGGMAEVMLGKLASKQASSQSVKNYAQQMIKDHTQANNELMKLAKAKGVTVPKTVNAQQQAMMSQLSKLSGKQFDQAYMKQAGVKSHAEQEALYRRETQQGQAPDLKAFATKTLPIVQEHLQLARKMTGSTAGANQTPQSPAR